MTTGDEQQPPFDPIAAAESLLQQQPGVEEYAPSEEDIAAELAEIERQRPLIEAFAEKGVQLDVADGETLLDKSIEATVEVDKLRDQWDSLSARILAGTVHPDDDATFDDLERQMKNALKKGELVDMAQYIDDITLNPDTTTLIDRIESTITNVATSNHLTPAEKQAYLDVLEATAGQESFSQAMEKLRAGTGLEEALGRAAVQQEQNMALARELQDLQEVLIHEFGIGNIHHEDWMPFTQHLHEAVQLQRSDNPAARVIFELRRLHIQEAAARLGIPSERLTTIFTRFGIADTED